VCSSCIAFAFDRLAAPCTCVPAMSRQVNMLCVSLFLRFVFNGSGTLVLCADGTTTCFAGKRKQENPGHFEFLQILANVAKAMVAHGRYLLTGIGAGKYQC
jgi:hypothetical protein